MNPALQGAKAVDRSHPSISPSLPLLSTSALQSTDETMCACLCMRSRDDEGVMEEGREIRGGGGGDGREEAGREGKEGGR